MASIGSIHAEQHRRLYDRMADEIACAVLKVRERYNVGYTAGIQRKELELVSLIIKQINEKEGER